MTQTSKGPIYMVTREKVTHCTGRYNSSGRAIINHPTVYTVAENGQDVCCFDTAREAREWIAAQG